MPQVDKPTEAVLVKLLNEGTEVVRPTLARRLEEGMYALLPTEDYDPKDENWGFPPGSLVQVKRIKKDGETHLLAVAKR
jgi:hypothetical protein